METKDRLNQPSPLTDKDHFFKKSVDQYTAAWQRKWNESFTGYADKYKEAVTKLSEIIHNDSYNKDQLTYPIMFLARHVLELRLKELVQLSNGSIVIFQKKPKCKLQKILDRFTGESATTDKQEKKHKEPTHSLSSLWDEFDKAYCGEKDKQYKRVGSLIKELNRLDSKSDTFRYPIHKNGTPTATFEFVDIENFIEVFLKVDGILEGFENELKQALDEMSNI